jgi:hypothetical protein
MGTSRPEASIEIDAPLEVVWSVMRDTTAYDAWNPFVEHVESVPEPGVGDALLLHVRWADGSTVRSPERVTVANGPETAPDGTTRATLAYAYEGLPARLRLIRGTRYQYVEQRPGGPTRYHTVEEFSGPMVRLAGPARVAEGFARHAAALKTRAESLS